MDADPHDEFVRKVDIELSMAEGAIAGVASDAADLLVNWPVSKRGSRANRNFQSLLSRVEAISACVRDARKALAEKQVNPNGR